ncbi:MAG: hypothetical protein RR355_03695 [Oscillospiraceae bacterium]
MENKIEKLTSPYKEGLEEKITAMTINNGNSSYLPVQARILWFRTIYPEGKIDSNVEISENQAIAYAKIYLNRLDAESSYVSKATARRVFDPSTEWGKNFEASAETAAIGRALAIAGFGTENTGDELTEGTYCETPLVINNAFTDIPNVIIPEVKTESINEINEKLKKAAHFETNVTPVVKSKNIEKVETLKDEVTNSENLVNDKSELREIALNTVIREDLREDAENCQTFKDLLRNKNAKRILPNIIASGVQPEANAAEQIFEMYFVK